MRCSTGMRSISRKLYVHAPSRTPWTVELIRAQARDAGMPARTVFPKVLLVTIRASYIYRRREKCELSFHRDDTPRTARHADLLRHSLARYVYHGDIV